MRWKRKEKIEKRGEEIANMPSSLPLCLPLPPFNRLVLPPSLPPCLPPSDPKSDMTCARSQQIRRSRFNGTALALSPAQIPPRPREAGRTRGEEMMALHGRLGSHFASFTGFHEISVRPSPDFKLDLGSGLRLEIVRHLCLLIIS